MIPPSSSSFSGSTIAAIATPPGVGAVAIVRLSGPDAPGIARRLLPRRAAIRLDGGAERLFSSFHHPETGERLDEGLVHVFPSPRSFTGENVVELHGHGGRVAPLRVLEAVLRAGARAAAAGEFTRRALLNGKVDLLEAEGLLDVIEARSEAQHRQAVYQLSGVLSREIRELRRALIEALGLLELQIDFSEEEITLPESWPAAVERVGERLRGLLATYRTAGLLREGVRVVLAGLPNVGKSSLFNLLVGEERAIVTAHPGTTRDAIEAEVTLDGVLFRLTDTAGIREARDEVEAIGVDLARRHLAGAEIVVLVTEATREMTQEERALRAELDGRPHLVVRAKADLMQDRVPVRPNGATRAATKIIVTDGQARDGAVESSPRREPILTSAVTGEGRGEIVRALLRLGVGDSRFGREGAVLTRLRHKASLGSALESVTRALAAVTPPLRAVELAAADLQDAARHMGEVTGEITSEDVLDRIFADFCIGK